MASPNIVGSITSVGPASAATHTPTLPAGYQAGETLVVVAISGAASASPPTIDQGYSSDFSENSSVHGAINIFTKTATGSEVAPTVTYPASISATIIMLRCDTGVFARAVSDTQLSSGNTSIIFPATTADNDALLLKTTFVRLGATTITPTITGTELYATADTYLYSEQVSAGAVAQQTYTIDPARRTTSAVVVLETTAPSNTTINVDIPADIDLEWGTTHELAVTHDGGTTTLSGVTLSAPTGWEYVAFTTAPDPGTTESFYEYAQTDTAIGSYTLQAGDLLAWETQTGLTVDGQTIPAVNPGATVTGAYKIWKSGTSTWSATSSFIINNLGQFVGIASVDSDNEINVNQVVTVQTEGFPTIEPSEWYAWYQGEPMDKVSWNSGQPQVRVPTSTGLSVDSSGDLVITWSNA